VTRPIILGNSRLHIGIGPNSDVQDIYYPYVGYADHVHRISIGAYTDGRMSWVRDGWEIQQRYLGDCPVGITEAQTDALHLKITMVDFVHHAWDVFWRKITIQNASKNRREVRLFSYQDLHIDENPLGDTSMLDPHIKAIVHYKNDFYFAFCALPEFNQFATGRKEWKGLEGTWRDADDGVLSGNAVSNGPVDSCVAWNFESLASGESRSVQLFMVAGRHFHDIQKLRLHARKRGLDKALMETERYWENWLANGRDSLLSASHPPERVQNLYNRSMLILRSMCSANGAIIASSDSDIERIGGDTYDYVWPRDASWCVIALDQCGYHEITRRFFNFIFQVMTKKGYLLQKYYPTGLFGSTWQPVPFIQIDQTGIVLHAFWNFYKTTGDIEFIAEHWPHVLKIACFLEEWRNSDDKLPHPSWDLWEERKATTTYSAAAVYAGITAASCMAKLVGLEDDASRFEQVANEIRDSILNNLYDRKLGRFLRSVNPRDEALDASVLAVSSFGAIQPQDPRLAATVKEVEDQLWVKTGVGGIARYRGDGYLRVGSEVIGNPWILTTLYLAMYHTDIGDWKRAKQLIEWATERASTTGLLSEQVNPYDGSPVGVLPLAWSHAAYILAVRRFVAQLSAKQLAWEDA
jgi:oligosaccharide amylase